MNLIRTTCYTGTATIIRTISGFVLGKIVAMQLGPSGLAFFGQFQNFIEMLMKFASGAINTGVIKYTSEFRFDDVEKRKIFSTALKFSAITSIPVILMLFFGSEYLSILLLKTSEYSFAFRIFSGTIFLFVLNKLLIAILNGIHDIKKYAIVNIFGSILTLLITGVLVYFWSFKGAVIALTINQSLTLFVTLTLIFKSEWFKWDFFWGKIDLGYCKKLLKYTAMALPGVFVVPASQMYLRNYVGESLGWNDAGYWQGMLKLSGGYLMMITTTLSVYYMPKLSSLREKLELKKEILYGFKMVMPVLFLIAFLVYLLRDWIIILLFTENFLPMRELFAVQLLGDAIKIASWLLANLMLAKAMSKTFIFSEIIFCLSQVVISIYFMNMFGLIGLMYAYVLNYFFYLGFNVFLFRGILFCSASNNNS